MAGPLILNRYRLLETRATGGFGTVDVSWDSRLQRRVAIKRIPLAIDETDLPGIQKDKKKGQKEGQKGTVLMPCFFSRYFASISYGGEAYATCTEKEKHYGYLSCAASGN
jgi:serine/threonine protein kinase